MRGEIAGDLRGSGLARSNGALEPAGLVLGEIRGGEVDGIWFKPGHADATHYLVHYLLYEARKAKEQTEALNFTISNPKAFEAVQVSHWQPHTILCVAYLRPPTLLPELAESPETAVVAANPA